jgi:arginine exporter protein ArgO
MSNRDWERLGAATGAVSVLLFIVGFGIFPTPPDIDAPATEIHAYYADHQSGIQAALVLLTGSLFFFIWFLGSLRSALRAAEGGTGRVSSIAFAGGVVGASALFVLVTLIAGAAFHPDQSTPEVSQAINDLAVVSAGPALAGLTALFAASAKVAFRHGAFSPAIGWLLALAALAQLFAVGAMLTDSGAFAGDGVLGFFLPIAAFAVTILVLSGALVQRAGRVDQPVAG